MRRVFDPIKGKLIKLASEFSYLYARPLQALQFIQTDQIRNKLFD